jgi:hypothetical protein
MGDLMIGGKLVVPGHTALPWHFWSDRDGAFSIAADAEHSVVICQRGPWSPGRAPEGIANARLFYAAPRMLTSLGVAWHALQCYAHGNSAPDLAAGVADGIGKLLIEATEGPHA